jgi:hypothetical protein
VHKDFTMSKVSAAQGAIAIVIVFVVAVTVCFSHPATRRESGTRLHSNSIAQSLNQKLEQKVQFTPKAEAPLGQLIEVAKTFHIPMGIEWSDSPQCKASPATFRAQETVGQLLSAIIRRCPTQRLTVEPGIVHVYSRFARHPRNILNLRVWRFQLKDGSVFDAQFELRLAIDMQLHPDKYAGGYNGGHGSPGEHVFSIPNVSFSGREISVRDVLDGIVRSSGNALWVARLRAASLNQRVPLSSMYKDEDEIIRIWEMLPLKETRSLSLLVNH